VTNQQVVGNRLVLRVPRLRRHHAPEPRYREHRPYVPLAVISKSRCAGHLGTRLDLPDLVVGQGFGLQKRPNFGSVRRRCVDIAFRALDNASSSSSLDERRRLLEARSEGGHSFTGDNRCAHLDLL
jgi:hypothetical protein